ncbi:proenkephalin-B-like [Scleropages formosus]|nr:proenkephalin-B [Scleropages formosus]
MEWCVLVLILSLASSIQADCSSQCLNCAQQIPSIDMSINSLTCTLECEGIFPSTAELDKCEKALQLSSAGHVELSGRDEDGPDGLETQQQEASPGNVEKRYGGFIKRIDKNKIYSYPGRENALLKGLFARKYGTLARKVGEREAQEPSRDAQGGRGALPEREPEPDRDRDRDRDEDEAGIEKVKRYGGFFRKFVPKRSEESAEEEDGDQEGLQKRYGGFMRRIRPKLKWNNQKRYGGFLRRHFKISVRSDEEPNSYDTSDL